MTNQQDSWPAGATATMNVTYTQANAAGGAVVCEISPGGGNEFIVLSIHSENSGTNGLTIATEATTAGVVMVNHALVASGAATIANINVGTVGSSPSTSNTASGLGYPVFVSGVQALVVKQTAAGAQNDTFVVRVNIRAKGALPTVIHSNSTNPANVSVTAGAESFATV